MVPSLFPASAASSEVSGPVFSFAALCPLPLAPQLLTPWPVAAFRQWLWLFILPPKDFRDSCTYPQHRAALPPRGCHQVHAAPTAVQRAGQPRLPTAVLVCCACGSQPGVERPGQLRGAVLWTCQRRGLALVSRFPAREGGSRRTTAGSAFVSPWIPPGVSRSGLPPCQRKATLA